LGFAGLLFLDKVFVDFLDMEILLNKLATASTFDELENATNSCIDYFALASESERQSIKTAMLTKTSQVMTQASQKRNKAERFLLDLERKHLAVNL
jgi:hypothetical protein